MASFTTVYELGQRVSDAESYRGTIRYVGPVAAAKDPTENWLGIEWDKSNRGKHDGSCVDKQGIMHRYFTCADGMGSFVKPSKVKTGRSFLQVLKERYVEKDAPLVAPGNVVPDAFVTTAKGTQKQIEFLGEEKLRKWQNIKELDKIAMRCENVGYCDDQVLNEVGHFTEIDLQDNLIWQWVEVAKFCKNLPCLKSMLLHGNKMQNISIEIVSSLEKMCFDSLRILALNGCNITSWLSFSLLLPYLDNLEELYLSSNLMKDMPVDNEDSNNNSKAVPLPALKVLDLSGCGLTDWRQIFTFGKLEKLEDLRVDDNALSKILPCPSSTSGVIYFSSLLRMSVSSTKITNWKCVDNLASYPSLFHIRLSHVPLFSGKGASEVRPIVIGRMPNLIFFNGSKVGSKERYDSEKSYFRRIMREVSDLEKTSSTEMDVHETINSTHPRYNELKEKYSAELLPMGEANNGADAGTLAAELVSITCRNMSVLSGGSLEPVVKKLPLSLTLSKLKILIKQLFNVEIELQQLSMRTSKDSPPFMLDDEESTLRYFGFGDGTELFINSVDG